MQSAAWHDGAVMTSKGVKRCGVTPQAQSIEAQAVEALFAVCLADVHAKQHGFDRAAELLKSTEAVGAHSCSWHMQRFIAAHASAVRALMSRLQGDSAGSLQHCQAGIKLACQALQEAEMNSVHSENHSQHSRKPRNRTSASPPSSSAAGQKASECSESSRPAQSESEARSPRATSASVPAWHAAALLAQLHACMAEYLWDSHDSEGAKNCLQAAREACQCFVSTEAPDAIPLQAAAILYQEVLLELGSLASVKPAPSYIVPCLGWEAYAERVA